MFIPKKFNTLFVRATSKSAVTTLRFDANQQNGEKTVFYPLFCTNCRQQHLNAEQNHPAL